MGLSQVLLSGLAGFRDDARLGGIAYDGHTIQYSMPVD